jgi:hypothetical protein
MPKAEFIDPVPANLQRHIPFWSKSSARIYSIDPVFAKTSPKRSFSISENERVRLVSAKTGSINSGREEIAFFQCEPDFFIDPCFFK